MSEWWTPYTTRLMIAWLFVGLVVWDVVLAVFVGNEATESKQMQWIGLNWPIVILAWGGLSAHFFCPKMGCWAGWWVEIKPALILVLGFVGFRVAWAQSIG
jgi:hypothetical protein